MGSVVCLAMITGPESLKRDTQGWQSWASGRGEVKSPMNWKKKKKRERWNGEGIQQEYILELDQIAFNNWSIHEGLQIPKWFHTHYLIQSFQQLCEMNPRTASYKWGNSSWEMSGNLHGLLTKKWRNLRSSDLKGRAHSRASCLLCSHSLGDQQDVLKRVAKDLDGDPAPGERVGEREFPAPCLEPESQAPLTFLNSGQSSSARTLGTDFPPVWATSPIYIWVNSPIHMGYLPHTGWLLHIYIYRLPAPSICADSPYGVPLAAPSTLMGTSLPST